jgi:hypothetical protein
LVRSRLSDPPSPPLGPGLLFGLEPAREAGEQQLEALVERAHLTALGAATLEACFARATAVEGCLVGALQPADHASLLATLTRIGDALVALAHD